MVAPGRGEVAQAGRQPLGDLAAGSRRRAAGNRAPAPRDRASPSPCSARSSASVRPSKLPQRISASRGSVGGLGEAQQAPPSRARGQRAGDAGGRREARRQPPGRSLRAALGAQRDVGLALDAAVLVPAGAGVADQADTHARTAVVRPARSPSASRSRAAGHVVPRHGHAPAPHAPMARRRAGSVQQGPNRRGEGCRVARRRRAGPCSPSTTMSGTPPSAPATTGSAGGLRLQQRHAVGLVAGRPDVEIGRGIDLRQRRRPAIAPISRTRSPNGANRPRPRPGPRRRRR